MKNGLQRACLMLYAVSAVAILFGLVYLLMPRIMPYHERYMGIPYGRLDPMIQSVMLLQMKDTGACLLALGIGIAWLVRQYLARGDRGILWPIAAMALVALIPVLLDAVRIGGFAPWWVAGPLVLLVLASIATLVAGAREGRGARGESR